MKVLKEIILCCVAALLTFFIFAVAGRIYSATDHTILTSIIVWTIALVLSYFLTMLIPFIIYKRIYYDGLVVVASLGTVIICCLARSKNLDDYLFVSVVGFVFTILGGFELILRLGKANAYKKKRRAIPKQYLAYKESFGKAEWLLMERVIVNLLEKESITIRKASILLEIGERKTSALLRKGVDANLLLSQGNTSSKTFFLNDKVA